MSEFNRPSTLTLRGSMHNVPRHLISGTLQPQVTDGGQNREPRVVRSDALLQGQTHVLIAHNGETYQLRATRLGKLILTK